MSLAVESETIHANEVPALTLIKSSKSTPKLILNAAMYVGGLLDTDLAAINNWIHNHIPHAQKLNQLGMLNNTTAHARTLLIAHRHRKEFLAGVDNVEHLEHYVLQKSWERLVHWSGLTIDGKDHSQCVDINFEAVAILDKIMFDKSKRAGAAGNHQWGLDVGPHELAYDPQFNGPDITHGQKYQGDDDVELVVCYISHHYYYYYINSLSER